MAKEKPLKSLKKYVCECCVFGCSQKRDLNVQLMTKKHITNEPLTNTKDKPLKPLKNMCAIVVSLDAVKNATLKTI